MVNIIGGGFLALVAIFVAYVGLKDDGKLEGSTLTKAIEEATRTLPACTSRDAADNFKKVFDTSQYAKTLNLVAIDAVDQKKISESPDGKKLVCHATLMFNNSTKETYEFTFTPARDGQFYIEARPASAAAKSPVQASATAASTTQVSPDGCVEAEMAKWEERRAVEISAWCAEAAKKGEECRVSAGQEADVREEALGKVKASCQK